MYRIETDSEGYTCHVIENKAYGTQLSVIPSKGGNITSFRIEGREIFYFDRTTLESPDGVRGGNPVLFPVCGRLAGGSYEVDERLYNMPLHGFAGSLPWRVAEAGEVGRNCFIKLELKANNLTKAIYPYSFRVVLEYVLTENSLVIRQDYFNEGDVKMPFYSGFHPYFLVSDKARLSFEINARDYMDYNEGKLKEYAGNIDFNKPVDFVFTLADTDGSRYAMTDPVAGTRLIISNEKPYRYLVMWTEAGKSFVCVEPWMAPPDALNTGKDLQYVSPGSSICSSTTYTVEKL